jgi:hypothetical protein
VAQSDGEILPAPRTDGEETGLEPKKPPLAGANPLPKKTWVSQTHGRCGSAEVGRHKLADLDGGFLPSSSFLFFLFSFLQHRDSFLSSAAWVSCGRMHNFFFAFFSLYERCQRVNGGQKTPPFCHIRIEDIPLGES